MTVCCCSLAGTAACQHCRNNPMATDVWTNKTVTVDHIDAKPFGNGLDVCPVCGKPTTIGKPQTKADQIRNMSDEELAELFVIIEETQLNYVSMCLPTEEKKVEVRKAWLGWLKQAAEDGEA